MADWRSCRLISVCPPAACWTWTMALVDAADWVSADQVETYWVPRYETFSAAPADWRSSCTARGSSPTSREEAGTTWTNTASAPTRRGMARTGTTRAANPPVMPCPTR
jgi:hypothetical protein